MQQTPIRKLRRDRTRQTQELSLAKASGDEARAAEIEKTIAALDKQIAVHAAEIASRTSKA
jgi:hypothetical protein